MRVRSRFLSVAFAVALSAAMVPTAVADAPPPEPMMVDCPEASEISAIVGETFTGGADARDSCSYWGPSSMGVSFTFLNESTTEYLAGLRTSTEEEGIPLVDVPELGSGAFGYESTYDLNLRWDDSQPNGQIYYLSVPLTHQNVALSLADLFVGAIAESPAPTVPAKDFAMSCPSAAQVSQTLGQDVTLVPGDQKVCAFKDGDKSINFSIVPGYGSIVEYRARVERDLSRAATPVPILDFGGLTPGAFAWADLSPTTLSWQLEDGVVAQLVALEDFDVLRRLAALFAAVQHDDTPPTTPPRPGTPGLPSTGV